MSNVLAGGSGSLMEKMGRYIISTKNGTSFTYLSEQDHHIFYFAGFALSRYLNSSESVPSTSVVSSDRNFSYASRVLKKE